MGGQPSLQARPGPGRLPASSQLGGSEARRRGREAGRPRRLGLWSCSGGLGELEAEEALRPGGREGGSQADQAALSAHLRGPARPPWPAWALPGGVT